VGHNEEPRPDLRGAHVESANSRPLRIVPEAGKVPENSIKATPSEGSDVLDRDEPRPEFPDDARELEP
jgi:hypothetical protein